MTYDLILRHGTCVLPAGILQTNIAVKDGKIAAIGDLSGATSVRELNTKNLHILPGVIDSQVHLREPGLEHKEDLASGTAAAAMGGVTCIFEMPNTKPSTVTDADFSDKHARAKGRAWVDYGFYIGASADNIDRLAALEALDGCVGVKIFMGSSTGTLLVPDDDTLLKVLLSGKRRVAVHAEDDFLLQERKSIAEQAATPTAHPLWRDEQVCLQATRRIINLARKSGRPIHLLHVTTAEEMDFLTQHRDIATVEVLPQHLTLCAPECYQTLGTLAQMNPPIRDKRHQDALWQAVNEGLVDTVASDHAPHTLEEKKLPYPDSPSGMTGVQTLVPLMLNHVHAGRLTLLRFVDLACAGPARVFGLKSKGRIAKGYDADFTIVDLKAKKTITNKWIVSKCGWTPFCGMKVTGWPKMTVVRGQIVMQDDALAEKPVGDAVHFS